jgi:cell division protein FtsQ
MPRVRKAPRNSVSDRPSPWLLLLRRQRKLLKPLAMVVAASLAVAFAGAAIRSLLPGSVAGGSLATLRERLGNATAASGLRVSDVVIEGRANTPEPLLRAAIGVSKGDPILGFSVEQARARIETLSWVEHATVERRLPGTVVVFLQERLPFAIWQHKGRFVLVDRSGTEVNQDVSQFRKLPLIVGEGAPAAAAVLLDALTDRPALAEKVAASVRVGERRWNLHMTNGADVMLPEGHEIAALDRLVQLQQEHALLDRPLAAIDMRLPDRLVLRPRQEAKDGTAVPPLPPAGQQQGGAAGPTTTAVPVAAKKPT